MKQGVTVVISGNNPQIVPTIIMKSETLLKRT